MMLDRRLPISRILLRYALFAAIGTFILSVVSLLDPRPLMGELLWAKPFRFWASTSIVAASLYWVLERMEKIYPREVKIISYGTVIAFSFEVVVITLQAARGVRSHFNRATPLDAVIFGSMGFFILGAWGLSFWATRLLFSKRAESIIADSLFLVAARNGMILFLAGTATGSIMLWPRSEQNGNGGHLFGAPDGAGSLMPLLGWSREFGDLRVAHFTGMHGLQILMVAYFLLKASGVSLKYSKQVLGLLSLAGGVLFGASLWQALDRQAVVSSAGGIRGVYFFCLVVIFGLLSGLGLKSFRKWRSVRKLNRQVI